MKTSVKLSGFLIVLTATAVYAAKPQIQWDPEYDFSGVSTFQWRDTNGVSLEERNPFLHSRIVNAIEYQLTASGLTEAQSDPDVYVTYFGSTDTEVRLQSDSYGYGFGGYGMGGWGYYGYGFGGPVSTTTRVVEYERGTLVVDIWDAGTNELVWRGTSSGIAISDNPEKTQKNVVKAIEKMGKQARKLRARAQ